MKISTVAWLGTLCGLGALGAARGASVEEKIPITTASAEARQLYLKGRDLAERLRATDARALFQPAAAKDPDFALAQVGLANTAGTAKEFFAAVSRAVALAGKASEGEQQIVCALDAGAKAELARQKECLTKLTQTYPNDERAHNLMGAFYFARQDWPAAVEEYKKATSLAPQFSQPYNQMGNVLLEAGRVEEAAAAYREQIATIDKADVPAQVKETARRQALFDEARVALARKDMAGAKAKAAAYATSTRCPRPTAT